MRQGLQQMARLITGNKEDAEDALQDAFVRLWVKYPEVPPDVAPALMTTTVKSMEETIRALHESGLACKVMVGGAVLTPEYAEMIGADYYAKDAKRSADIAKKLFGVN